MPHNYTALSPSEFETLAADILSAVHSVAFERYAEGRDGGIDCRHETASGEVWVGQAKRYKDVAALLRAMPKEQQKMQALATPPSRYFLVTACSLTPGNKETILKAMQPFIQATADIYGADDLDALLHQCPGIYRKHYRLWLHSIEQLAQYLNQAHYARADMVHEHLLAEAKVYVVPAAQHMIIERLAAHHCCLIVGDPGSGKSTTAGQVALRLQLENPSAELVWINDRNLDQALQLIRPDTDQILVLDDFLGATFLDTAGMLAFQRDWQALLFKARQASGRLKLLFTTRNYIMEQALSQLGDSHAAINQLCRQAVCMRHPSAQFRAELVYRLIQGAGFTETQLTTLVEEKLYWPLIESANFSPRLMAMVCEKLTSVPSHRLKVTIEQGIEGQRELWQQVFQRLSAEAQTLVYLVGLAGNNANARELKRSFNTLYPGIHGRVAPLNGFDQAMLELEPTFITSAQHLGDIWVSPVNPSLVDYLHGSIADNGPLIDALIGSLEHFDWGLRNFRLSERSHNPIALKTRQWDALVEKLLELLTEPGSNLLQMFSADSVAWSNRPDTFGGKLSKLWRAVMHDSRQATRLIEKLSVQLPEAQHWSTLYSQGGMAELLDLTGYLSGDVQPLLWELAMKNLHNSEDAAALAELYRQNPKARDVLKPKWRELKRSIKQACGAEIEGADDPDHLDCVLADIYRIEDALDLDLKPLVQDIYFKLDDDLDEEMLPDEPASFYYQDPEGPDNHGEVLRQLRLIRREVDGMFAAT